jgi:hypothetical protein
MLYSLINKGIKMFISIQNSAQYTLLAVIVFCLLPLYTYGKDVVIGDVATYQDSGCSVDANLMIDAILKGEELTDIIEWLHEYDLKMLRNTIFARNGYIFNSQKLKDYFKKKSWYTPKYNKIKLSPKEEDIIAFIKRVEKCDKVEFSEFKKLFVPLNLPFSFNYSKEKSKKLNMLFVRTFLKRDHCYTFPFYTVGTLYQNKDFVVLLYKISSLLEGPGIAIYKTNGELISKKHFFLEGGDLQHSTRGTLDVSKDLKIHIKITERKDDVESVIVEDYVIDSGGNLKKK